eukprot:1145880-Pelagomonas_calceolata.AAC.2
MSKLLIDCKLRNDCTWAPCAFKRRRRKNSWGSGPGLLVSNLTGPVSLPGSAEVHGRGSLLRPCHCPAPCSGSLPSPPGPCLSCWPGACAPRKPAPKKGMHAGKAAGRQLQSTREDDVNTADKDPMLI